MSNIRKYTAPSNQKEKEEKMWPDKIPEEEKRRKKLMEAFDYIRAHGYLWEAGDLKEVIFYFSTGGSDDEIDKLSKGQYLGYYTPNARILRRLQNELPYKITLVFKKHGVELILTS